MALTSILCLFMVYTSAVMIFGCAEYNMQYCSNCKAVSSVCTNDVGFQLPELCESTCLPNIACRLGEYIGFGICYLHSCTQIEEDVTAAGYFTLRKVCQLSDCLNYTLTTLHGHTGTCHVLETHTVVASLIDCSMMCLDTESCRGSTFYGNGTCLLHDCGNNSLGTIETTFIKRSCSGDTSYMTSLTTATLGKGTTKHSRPSLLTTEMTSAAHTHNVEPITITMTASSEPPVSVMTTFVDKTLTTTPFYLSNTYKSSDLPTASKAGATKSTNNDNNNFLDKPSNVAVLASAGGVVVGAAVGMGVATKCQKRAMHT